LDLKNIIPSGGVTCLVAKATKDKDVEFVVTITPSHKSKLWLPIDFVASAGIESKENITMKSLDGNETQMSIRTCKQRHCSTQYHLSVGWPAFKRSNNISESDECVFMYTTSEDKMCLAKITKKENVKLVENCMEVDVDDNKDEDENVKLVDDGMDGKDVVVDDNKDEDENVKPKSEWLLDAQTDCVQDTAQRMKLKRLKASTA
ncbi:DNA-binding pseudobarrel domain-containing protein, partial [Tanacetum coccineum]